MHSPKHLSSSNPGAVGTQPSNGGHQDGSTQPAYIVILPRSHRSLKFPTTSKWTLLPPSRWADPAAPKSLLLQTHRSQCHNMSRRHGCECQRLGNPMNRSLGQHQDPPGYPGPQGSGDESSCPLTPSDSLRRPASAERLSVTRKPNTTNHPPQARSFPPRSARR